MPLSQDSIDYAVWTAGSSFPSVLALFYIFAALSTNCPPRASRGHPTAPDGRTPFQLWNVPLPYLELIDAGVNSQLQHLQLTNRVTSYTTPDGFGRLPIAPDGSRRLPTASDGLRRLPMARLLRMATDGFRWLLTAPYGFRMAPDGFRRLSTAPDCSRRLPMAPDGSSVMTDVLNICDGISKLKKRVSSHSAALHRRAADLLHVASTQGPGLPQTLSGAVRWLCCGA